MGNPNPKNTWKPGQSGNPGGKTSAQRKLEVKNAERATRITAKLLKAVEAQLGDASDEEITQAMDAVLLRLIKDSQDRGLGVPKGEGEAAVGVTINVIRDYDTGDE